MNIILSLSVLTLALVSFHFQWLPASLIITLTVLILALICFVFEWLPVDLTAIIVAIVLMIFGVVTPEEGIAGFGNSATITVMAMFILSAGITRTGAIQVVRDWLLTWGGKSTTQQILILGLVVGPISAFTSPSK